jgi:hypothetical protein
MSSKIFELFGYLTDDKSPKAQKTRQSCTCPFMGLECDGGGNRYQSFLHLDPSKDKPLVDFFQGRTNDIPAGVCSLVASETVWIVCPRRLFTLDAGDVETTHEKFSANLLKKYFGFASSQRVGVWTEVKLKYAEDGGKDDENSKTFDYTFDYVISPLGPKPLAEAAAGVGFSEKKLQKKAEELGFMLASRNGVLFFEDYPVGPPQIVEVMTSSTSGGNKQKGTTIQNAFRRAVLGQSHEAPGINYRQIWARMVSQLIVKSQIGKAWGGRTIWVLQDALTDYISQTTNLNLKKLIFVALREVNILSLRYAKQRDVAGTLLLEENNLYAGEIPPVRDDTDFNRLLQAASIPPASELESKLVGKRPRSRIEF